MAFDAFLKIDGIKGESRDEFHRGWIEIESFNWGVSQSGSFAGGKPTGGKSSLRDFTVRKELDKSSPKLMLACATGAALPSIMMHCARNKNDKQVFLEYQLTDCLISSYSPSGANGGGEVPMEEISFVFPKVEILYREIDLSSGEVKEEIKESYPPGRAM